MLGLNSPPTQCLHTRIERIRSQDRRRLRVALPTLLLASAACLQATLAQDKAATPESPKVDRIILVFKTHFDIGYTDMAVNVIHRYRTEMIDKALLEQSKKFRSGSR